MITLKVEDLTIKQIIKICKEQTNDTCKYCPIKNYCDANFVGQPKFFEGNTDNEDLVDFEVRRGLK